MVYFDHINLYVIFFSVCVSLNGQRNALVYSNADLAPNDLFGGEKKRHFYFTIYSSLFKVSPHRALFAQKLVIVS